MNLNLNKEPETKTISMQIFGFVKSLSERLFSIEYAMIWIFFIGIIAVLTSICFGTEPSEAINATNDRGLLFLPKPGGGIMPFFH